MEELSEDKERVPVKYQFDRNYLMSAGGCMLAGIDEAGRGPLAGPVVVAGVILPSEPPWFPVEDSKRLSAARREELAEALRGDSRVKIAVSVKSAAEIDAGNILRATQEGMREVASQLKADLTLVDGCRVPDFPVAARFIVKGDAKSASIAAASIVAKVTHDRILRELDEKYPQYGFAAHMGYGTKQHWEALEKYGPCPEHRKSFVRHKKEPPMEQLELPFG